MHINSGRRTFHTEGQSCNTTHTKYSRPLTKAISINSNLMLTFLASCQCPWRSNAEKLGGGGNVIMRNHHSCGYSTTQLVALFFCFFSVTTWSHSPGRVRRCTPVLLSLTSSVHDFFCWPVSTADTYDSSWWMTMLSLHTRKYHTASSLIGRATCTISQQRIFSTNIFTGIQVLVRWRTTTLQNRIKYGTTNGMYIVGHDQVTSS